MSTPETWDWSLRIFDHVDVHASDYPESVRFYETVLAPLGIPMIAESEGWTCFTNLTAPGYGAAYLLDPERSSTLVTP
jgi:hypothetical protein